MGAVLQSIYGLHGKTNMAGFLANQFYFAPSVDFLIQKGRKATSNAGDAVTIDGTHTFAGQDGFYQVDTDLDSTKLSMDQTGKQYSTGHKMKVEFNVSGNEKDMAEIAMCAPTEKFICILKEAHLPGRALQFGEDGLEATLKFKHENGVNSEGKKMWLVEMECVQHSMLYYEGNYTIHV